MERHLPPPQVSSSIPPQSILSPPSVLRSSVSMFIEDSRITAVANAEPPPPALPSRRPSSFFSVTSYTSSSTSTATGGVGGGACGGVGGSAYLRPTFSQISTTLPGRVPPLPQHQSPSPQRQPRACSSSPVRFPGREFIHNIIREDEEAEQSSGGMVMSMRSTSAGTTELAGGGGRRPPPPSSTVRRRSTLSVEPNLMDFLNVKEALPSIREDRAYTSVNLTLRVPSGGGDNSGCGGAGVSGGTVISAAGGMNVVNTVNVNMGAGPGGGIHTFRHTTHSSSSTSTAADEGRGGDGCVGGIDIPGDDGVGCSTSGATNLMYSTYSNSRDGFEAQVQIQFGPNGGTFTASRRRRSGGGSTCSRSTTSNFHLQQETHHHNISIRQQMSTDLLSAQTERVDKLRTSLQDRRCLLSKLQTEIVQLRHQLQLRSPIELEKLKKDNRKLRVECDYMAREVDLYQNGSVPLGETSEEFYQGINPGQSLNALFGITNNRRKIGGPGGQPPPRPPPPKFLQSPTHAGGGRSKMVGDEGMASPEEGEWMCSMCTFQNHRDLDFCEQCQMVRVKCPQQQQQSSSQQQKQPYQQQGGGYHHQFHHHGPRRGEQNIRIRVRRRRHRAVDDGEGYAGGDEHHRYSRHLDEDDDDKELDAAKHRQRVVHSWVL